MMNREKLELEKLEAEIRNLGANTQKVLSEIRKIERERTLYPVVMGAAVIVLLSFLMSVLAQG